MNLWSLYCKNKKEYNGTFVDFVKDFSNCREDFGSKKIIYSKTIERSLAYYLKKFYT
jgi:hypothetical protein